MYATAVLVVMLGFICQVRMEDCPGGWLSYESKCFKVIYKRTNWHNARVLCRHNGGILAEPADEGENTFIANIAKYRAWIGLNDIHREGTFLTTSLWHVATYDNWYYNEPNNAHNEDCAEINFPHAFNGLWNDIPCTYSLNAFVCERRRYCPSNWVLRGNYCYFPSPNIASWYAAKRICNSIGGYLAEPKTQVQNHYVRSLKGRTWIGLIDQRFENRFVWDSTNEPVTWKNWSKREPNNYHNEDCTEIVHWAWNDLNCATKRSFVCQRNPY